MKTTPKTDECIGMLSEAQSVFNHFIGNGYFDIKHYAAFLNRVNAVLKYRLLPNCIITIDNNVDKDKAKENELLKNVSDFDAFWYAMKNYQLVTITDLKNEFWELCPNIDNIQQFIDVMNKKFQGVNYLYDADIDKIKARFNIIKFVENGEITNKEADEMFWNIYNISHKYNFVMERVRAMFKEFREIAQGNDKKTIQITLPDNLLKWLQDTICSNGKGYIENAKGKPLKWLQNKQLAFELVTHDKIKNKLSKEAAKRELQLLFIYHKDNKPLILRGKSRSTKDTRDHNKLMNFLATL